MLHVIYFFYLFTSFYFFTFFTSNTLPYFYSFLFYNNCYKSFMLVYIFMVQKNFKFKLKDNITRSIYSILKWVNFFSILNN